jgi:NADH-quinone oxidoreductase subunit H
MVLEQLIPALVYPGLVFVVVMSLIYSGILRKLAARMQNRVGPPLWQPFLDTLKLLNKEDIKPEQAKMGYTFWPFISMISITIAALLTPIAGIVPLGSSDVIILVYFLIFGTLALYLTGFSSSNPFAVVGAVRGIVQMIGYEFPFVVSIIVATLAAGSIFPIDINSFQTSGGMIALTFPLAALAYFITILAKVEIPPFHTPEAHQEIVAGYYTEYTGSRLAMILMTHMLKLFVLISIGIAFFFGGSLTVWGFLITSLILLFFVTLSRVIMARFRIDYVLRFCWIFGFIALIDLARLFLA